MIQDSGGGHGGQDAVGNACPARNGGRSGRNADGPGARDRAIFAEEMRQRARSRRRAEELRLERGHVWRGGFAGDNPAYQRGPQVTRGLVSDRHEMLKLFVSKLPRGVWRRDPERRLKSGTGKALLEDADSKLLALDEAYVEANRFCCGILRVEINHELAIAEIATFCDLPVYQEGRESAA